MNQTLRSLIFNIAFYSYTVVWCFLLMWAFALPRAWALRSVMIYFNGITWIERIFMKLDYHVEGWEHLPKTGSYILAMKHQSAYETLKLLPLFGDIAVVLKRELTWIPFWGWYTIKVGMIPVDRGARGRAMASMMAGARRVVAQGRPIVIFPQGTRVAVDATPADKPYKFGVAKLAEALQIPIVPVALNSGVFWGRKAFTKRSGVIDFKILPPIMPGQPAQEVMSQLETALETESDALAANAKIDHPVKPATPGWLRWVLIALIVVFALWGAWWYTLAGMIEKQITMRLAAQDGPTQISSPYTRSLRVSPARLLSPGPRFMWSPPPPRLISAHWRRVSGPCPPHPPVFTLPAVSASRYLRGPRCWNSTRLPLKSACPDRGSPQMNGPWS